MSATNSPAISTPTSATKCGGSSASSTRRSASQRIVNRLRNTNPEKFCTMCKMHLSFLLDLSGASLEELLSEPHTSLRRSTGSDSVDSRLSGSLSNGDSCSKPKRHHLFSRKRNSKGSYHIF